MKHSFSAPPEVIALVRSEAASRELTVSQLILEALADRYGIASGRAQKQPAFAGVDIPEGVVIG